MHCSRTVHGLFTHLKIGPTVLFTYLKIIKLFRYNILIFSFQFSVTISSIQMDIHLYIYIYINFKLRWYTLRWRRPWSYIQNTKTINSFFLETIYKYLDKSRSPSRFWWLTTTQRLLFVFFRNYLQRYWQVALAQSFLIANY